MRAHMKLPRQPTEIENRLITYVEQHWHEHRRFPSPVLICAGARIDAKDINALLSSDVVRVMLDNRGITMTTTNSDDLSPEQLAAANTYLNIADPRPLNVKLKELGINPVRFHGWMRGKVFGKYIRERSEDLLDDAMPFAHRELLNKVMHGNMDAIKHYYAMTGRYTGVTSGDAQNVGLVIQRLLEAIQMEVSDPELLSRIAGRFQSITSNEPPTYANVPASAPKESNPQRVLMQRVIAKSTSGNESPPVAPKAERQFGSEDDHGISF